MVIYGKGRPRGFSSNNQWVGRSMGAPSQVRAVPEPKHVNLRCIIFSLWVPNFPCFSCLNFLVGDNIPKNSFWGGCWKGLVHLQYLLWADKGQQTLTTRGNCLSYFFPWDSFIHSMSELLPITIRVPHGDLDCS
jgi:hypothetical protein